MNRCTFAHFSRFCEQCMLDANCGFCYFENGSAISDSSCEPVNPANAEQAASGRFDFEAPKSLILTVFIFPCIFLSGTSDVFMLHPGASMVPKKTQVHCGPITTAQPPIPG